MNKELLNELYKKYDKKELKEFDDQFIDEQVADLHRFCQYEDCNELYKCKNLEELIELYKFVLFGVGVEFVASVYDLMADEEMDGDTETEDMCKEFNKAFGRKFFAV